LVIEKDRAAEAEIDTLDADEGVPRWPGAQPWAGVKSKDWSENGINQGKSCKNHGKTMEEAGSTHASWVHDSKVAGVQAYKWPCHAHRQAMF